VAKITASTFERGTLVVVHVFIGNTLTDTERILNAHLKTDSFLKASMLVQIKPNRYIGRWKTIDLLTVLAREP
jgi:hypothetical protein